MTTLADRADELYSSRVITYFVVYQESKNYVLRPEPVTLCAARRGVADADPAPRFFPPGSQCWYHATYGPFHH